jgi:tRNA pseudouridine38-40 synthase
LEIEPLNKAAILLLGTHDFSAFGTPPQIEGNTVRTVTEASWQRYTGANDPSQSDHSDLFFDIVANAFLYRMVRRLVFIQVAIGQGRLDEEKLVSYLTSPPDSVVQGLAPPQGLSLVGVVY